MQQQTLTALLATITGNLYASSAEEQDQLDVLQEQLAQTLQHQDVTSIKAQPLTFESADFFFSQNMKPQTLDKISSKVKLVLENNYNNDLKVFVREVPIRTSQVVGSVPDWAGGGRVTQTIGPIIGNDGRRRWFDFYKVEKLVAIYFQGIATPAILFKAAFTVQKIIGPVRPPEVTKNYDLVAGSVWINAKILSASAPQNRYCGIRVKSGKIGLGEMPALVSGKLTVPAGTTLQVSLEMEPPPADTSTAADAHGEDARNLKLNMPSAWSFSFTAATHKIFTLDPIDWTIYGQTGRSEWKGDQAMTFDGTTNRILVPLANSDTGFEVQSCKSPFQVLSGKTKITKTWWGIPTAVIDVNATVEADGSGAILLLMEKGLSALRTGVSGTDTLLPQPLLIAEPGRIGITDLKSNALGSTQEMELWKDELNPHGSRAAFTFLKNVAFVYNTSAKGDELLLTVCDAEVQTDRPVKVDGAALPVKTKNSVIMLASSAAHKILALYDDNIIFDNSTAVPGMKLPAFEAVSIALENALFNTTPVNGCLLAAEFDANWKKALYAKVFLTLGLYAYLPTLPDPYVANINLLKRQFAGRSGEALQSNRQIWLWLVCRISSKPAADDANGFNAVKTSFHFGNLPYDDEAAPAATENSNKAVLNATTLRSKVGAEMLKPQNVRAAMYNVPEGESGSEEIKMMNMVAPTKHNYEKEWDDQFGNQLTDSFALLDVSSNANQMGISFGLFGQGRMAMMRTAEISTVDTQAQVNNALPFLVNDMQVMAKGMNVRAFTLPQVAWEPVFNLTPPVDAMDPPFLFNYYPNDGGPSRFFNMSNKPVPLAPLPVVDFLVDEFKASPKSFTVGNITLPWGLKAITAFTLSGQETIKPGINKVQPAFAKCKGGLQLSIMAGNAGKNFPADASLNDSPMLPGFTVQINNILDMAGAPTATSNLAEQPTIMFNKEFFNPAEPRGVPVCRMDISGYGANMFSNWVSPSVFVGTSQARFDIMLGRTGHEVVQVKSILYPWGIKVVRTITLHRESSGYVYRQDSGWQPESDGLFDFRYYPNTTDPLKTPYSIHPGIVRGLFNVRNITVDPTITPFKEGDAECRAVFFDADVEIEDVVQGRISSKDKFGKLHTSCVVSKRILGYVQLTPIGKPLSPEQFRSLLNSQNGSIGGPIDCQADIHESNQNIRLNQVDVSPSVNTSGNIIFVVAARGNVILPKDGSWSIVQHNSGTGEVTPLNEGLTVPLIREGEWIPDKVIDVNAAKQKLLRMAHPMELLRNVTADTINFGILQNMGTQKALFLTPSFKRLEKTLLSKTPPIFSDAYRMMTGNGIFPNIGDAVTDFGKAFSLMSGTDAVGNAVAKAFAIEGSIKDGVNDVFKLLQIDAVKQGEAAVEQGMQLIKGAVDGAIDKALKFNLPDFDVPLVDMESLKIYIEYKTSKLDKNDPKKDEAGTKKPSQLNFDIASKIGAAATDAAETWKGRLNDLSMVVDLGDFKRLMRIKGNFDAKKGKPAGYGGDEGGEGGLPYPEIEIHPALQPIIDLLQVLAQLSAGDYGAALKKGLQIAMGNAGEIWEYKFEATKEIPLVRFPPTKELYDNPQTPLKLEASMGLGVYFNAALKITTDPSQLLPTAGAFLKFHGGLSVMCVSVGVGTIYAVGAMDVKIACDTAVGPNLTLKFGFGASITVGLPVVGHATVTFMVGVEMYADSKEISITAMMLFKGNAELLGGLVSVTITIEAKGTVKRIGNKTDCSAQVTFAIDISIFLIIDISFSETWGEQRQVA